MDVLIYFLVFIASLLVDVVPFAGPPAWTVMVFFQVQYKLNIWTVLVFGVAGSAVGRYIYSQYIPYISDRFLKSSKKSDLQFMGKKFTNMGWKAIVFVFFYTLLPLPSTPLFTAVGIARIKVWKIMPSFIAGKFISDAALVVSGDYVAKNAYQVGRMFLSWQNLAGILFGLIAVCLFLFIDWRKVLTEKKITFNFNIWK